MSNHPIYRVVLWEIQDIDEIVPAGIQIQRILVCNECWSMLTIVLIDCSHLKVAVAKGSEPSLGGNDSGLWRKRSLVKRNIKIKRAQREKFRNRLYGYRVTWKRRRQYNNAEYPCSSGWKLPDT
jgi:hypothetical protein